MLPRSCWCPTSLQLLKAWRASWRPPQRKWGLCKHNPWVSKTPPNKGRSCDVDTFRWKHIFYYLTLVRKIATHLRRISSMNEWNWSSFAVAVRYPLCAGPYHRQWCLQPSCCRVCSTGPQPHWHHWWPWLETLHVCKLACECFFLLQSIN